MQNCSSPEKILLTVRSDNNFSEELQFCSFSRLFIVSDVPDISRKRQIILTFKGSQCIGGEKADLGPAHRVPPPPHLVCL